MFKKTMTVLVVHLLLCPLLSVTAGAQSQSIGPSAGVGEIEALIEAYAKSINEADVRLASDIWATDSQVSFINPRGHERGWEQIKTNFYEKTMGANFSERKLIVRDLVVHLHGDIAWAEFYWDFAAKMKKDGTQVNTQGRETQIFRKTNRGWRLVHVHYSGMPVTGERQGF